MASLAARSATARPAAARAFGLAPARAAPAVRAGRVAVRAAPSDEGEVVAAPATPAPAPAVRPAAPGDYAKATIKVCVEEGGDVGWGV